ncbi:hypothetical protein CYMTET_45535 [Cymbomonas tetramitiformis]|uniref:ABC transporter domain-containing protein n=1 Tax=Cymbomonas tetramitiformis TaxID=36881 RepID=A0AAE0BZT9_9CHLO|nr:hypothetical protein CYMTET_45535 [Cymbomonas tetramitiformis]
MGELSEKVAAAVSAALPEGPDVDEDIRSYVIDCATSVLEDVDDPSAPVFEDLIEAIGPILEGVSVDEDSISSLCKKLENILKAEGEGEGSSSSEDKKDYVVALKDIRMGFGGRMLLARTQLMMEKNHRYGLVGDNGIGKTTLLTRLSKGDINGWPGHLQCVYVQHEVLSENRETVLEFTLADAPPGTSTAECTSVLNQVGFEPQMQAGPVTELSGGWRMKLAIARAMLQKADILMLDEPTNHLDVSAVDWLIAYLKSLQTTTVLFVSHDQEFLSEVATDIIHFTDKQLTNYIGGFDAFRSAQPDAAMGGFKAFQEAQEKKKQLNAVGSACDQSDETMMFTFPNPGPLDGVRSRGKVIMRMDGVSFTYPGTKRTILSNVSIKLTQNSRVCIVGANGAGKSTLLRLLVGELFPNPGAGEVTKHHNLRVAYIAQHSRTHLEAHLQQTPIEYIQTRFFQGADKQILYSPNLMLTAEEEELKKKRGNVEKIVSRAVKGKTLVYEVKKVDRPDKDNSWEPLHFLSAMQPYVMKMVMQYDEVMRAQESGMAVRPLTSVEIRAHLADFQIDRTICDNNIKGLSGGQKSRLLLAAAMWTRPHILALDEPTNYLDQEALGALARSIHSFLGGVLMVSHNEDFVKELTNESWQVKDGTVRTSSKADENFGEAFRESDAPEEGATAPRKKRPPPKDKSKKVWLPCPSPVPRRPWLALHYLAYPPPSPPLPVACSHLTAPGWHPTRVPRAAPGCHLTEWHLHCPQRSPRKLTSRL